jgi:asparagine synthase (glutamine-hydrolysing)
LEADRPIAFLLSGGVDSSLVAGIATKLLNKQINTYCCGMNEGTDLIYARKVAKYIKSNHTEVLFTPQEGLNAIRDVILTTETWDTTTIRASIGQYLVCKYIGNTNAKVVMVGEGPDEVCSSYLFNYNAPSGKDLHTTALEYVDKIHLYDGRRADRCISRWGLEGRIALLDPEFIKSYWSVPSEMRHPKYKGIEKWWLRKAFENTNTIPDEVLWRKKEAFSDGISSKEKSWFEILQDYIKTQVTEEEWKSSNIEAPTLEAYYYKKIFIELFGTKRLGVLPNYWQPKWVNNNGQYIDPSARVLNVYSQ